MTRALRLLLLPLAALLSLGIGYAQTDPARSMPPQPLPHPVIQRDLTLTDMRVDIRIDGGVARTTVRQTLRNDNSWVAEGQYMLPLPPGASVSDFALIDGDTRLSPKLLPAEEARRTYQEIVRKMRDPGLLEYQDRSTYSVAVFPFQPGQSRSVEVSFSQPLGGTTELLAYQLPLRWAGWSRIESGGAQLTLTYEVNSDHPLGTLSSPTYAVSVNRQGEQRASGSFEGRVSHFSSDFTLNVGRRTGDFAASLLVHPPAGGEDGYFLLSLLAALPQNAERVPKDVVFVFDKSGSMAGTKIQQAKDALRFVLDQLHPDDRFNVVYYSDNVMPVFPDGLMPATSATVDAARRAVDDLRDEGGTDIDSALMEAARQLPAGSTRPRYVIFLTDGQPTVGETDIDRIVANAKTRLSAEAKLFVFGVGYDVNTTLLDSLSYNHHGSATYVTEGENIESKVGQFYAKMASPALINLAVSLSGMDVYDLMPRQLPDLFHNNEIFIAGRFRGRAPERISVTVDGQGEGAARRQLTATVTAGGGSGAAAVPRLWATRKVSYLLDQLRLHGDNPELLGEIDRLAMRFGIVTPYTSYLITEPGMAFEPEARRAQLEENVADAREDLSGIGAVYRSKQSQSNQAADVAAAPQSAGGSAGGAAPEPYLSPTVPPPPMPMLPDGTSMDQDEALEQLRRSGRADTNTTVNYVNEQTFVRETLNDRVQWVDSRYAKDAQATVRVQTYSAAYFELLDAHPELADYLAQGENVVLWLSESLALEVTEDEAAPSAEELQRVRAALAD